MKRGTFHKDMLQSKFISYNIFLRDVCFIDMKHCNDNVFLRDVCTSDAKRSRINLQVQPFDPYAFLKLVLWFISYIKRM